MFLLMIGFNVAAVICCACAWRYSDLALHHAKEAADYARLASGYAQSAKRRFDA